MKKYFIIYILIIIAIPTFAKVNNYPKWLNQTKFNLERVANLPPEYRFNFFHDCGIRSLSAAFLLCKKPFSLADIEDDLKIWDKGTNLARLEKCAQKNGLYTLAIQIEPSQLIRLKHFAILHVKSNPEQEAANHYVLCLENDKQNHVHIIDPSFYDKWLSTEDISNIWNGVALVLSTQPISLENLFNKSFINLSATGYAVLSVILVFAIGVVLITWIKKRHYTKQ